MEKFSQKCCKILLKYKIISEEEKDIYVYGFELFNTTTFSVFSILGIAVLLNQIKFSIEFILVFFILRMFSGGYHANTHRGCFIITNIAFIISICARDIMLIIPEMVQASIFMGASYYVCLMSPRVNPNQPLSEEKFRKNQKYARIYLCLIFIIVTVLYILNLKEAAISIETAVIMVFLMMIIKPKRRKKYVEIT